MAGAQERTVSAGAFGCRNSVFGILAYRIGLMKTVGYFFGLPAAALFLACAARHFLKNSLTGVFS